MSPYRSSPPTLAAAPRRVPLSLRLALIFGGAGRQVGLAISTAVLLLAAAALTRVDSPVMAYDRRAPGTVIAVETGDDDTPRTMHVRARFTDHAGARRVVRSYSEAPPDVGDSVVVEYDGADPTTARIVGMRARGLPRSYVRLFSFGVMLALGFTLYGLFRTRGAIRLLRAGVLTRGRLVEKTLEKEEYDGKTPELTFEFPIAGGAVQLLRVGSDRALEDDQTEAIVYDPGWPDRAFTLDNLPGSPLVEADGRLRARGRWWRWLLLPAANVLVTGLALYNWLSA